MGFERSYPVRCGPCPGCGKEQGAFMFKPAWGHGVSCCCDECGERVGRALQTARDSEQYRFFQHMKHHAEDMMSRIEEGEKTEARVGAGGPKELSNPFAFAVTR